MIEERTYDKGAITMKRQEDWYTGKDYYHTELFAQNSSITVKVEEIYRNLPLTQNEEIEMIYILEGEAVFTINGVEYEGRPAAWFMLEPYHFFEIRLGSECLKIYSLTLPLGVAIHSEMEQVPKKQVSDLLYEGKACIYLDEGQRQRIVPLFLRMLEEKAERQVFHSTLIRLIALELIAYFSRFSLDVIAEGEAKPVPVEWRAVQRIMLSTHQRLTLHELAEEYQIEPAVLNRKIRAVTGKSFCQNQNMIRMVNACALLHFPQLTVSYISELLCYGSLNTFYQEFAKCTGMKPEEYRERKLGMKPENSENTDFMVELLVYLYGNFRAKITAEEAAEALHISQSSLQKTLRKQSGCTFLELLSTVRLKFAKGMLSSTKFPVCDVAIESGFESVSTFNRVFKTYLGVTPSQYRKEAVKKE